MQKYYQNKFALTESGARDLTKASLASFAVYLINLVPAFLIMLLADQVLAGRTKADSLYYGLALVCLVCLNFFLKLEYDALFSTTYKESANLRIETSEHLAKLPLSYFSKHDLSDIAQTIMADVEGIEHAMSHSIPKLGGMAIFFPLISLMLLSGNWQLGLAVVLPSLFSFIFIPLSRRAQVKSHSKYYQVLRENSEAFQENIELQQEIKSLNLLELMRKDLYKKMEESERIHLKSESITILILSLSNLFAFISLGLVIMVGALLVSRGEINLVFLLGYLLAAIKFKEVLDSSKESLMEVFYLDPKVERIKQIQAQTLQEGRDLDLKSFDLELKAVEFAYDQDNQVLRGVSFKANQGQVTALVGASGSGKTTILRLISRLYDYDRGQILIDGHELKDISTKSLFSKVSIVFQDVTLFNASVLDNIRIGREGASDEEVKRAAELANCAEFIDRLEFGYDTLIGENGAELSGGERQRLSIARAFLKDAPILILDEIAASLDVDNEQKIQASLNRLIENKTVIVISHRMKSIEQADQIVVLNQGRVECQGSHADLLRESKTYQTLVENTHLAESFIY